jgi:hypothetical protein
LVLFTFMRKGSLNLLALFLDIILLLKSY